MLLQKHRQARELNGFSRGAPLPGASDLMDAVAHPSTHFAHKTPLFLSLSPCRSDYPPPRPISKNALKFNGLQNCLALSEKRMFGVADETGIELVSEKVSSISVNDCVGEWASSRS